MIDAQHAHLMARYNAWMNDKIYEACAGLPDARRREDAGAFFGSIHATLNHILVIDLIFMSRFTGNPESPPAFDAEPFGDFDTMRLARRGLDERLRGWSNGLTTEWLLTPVTFTSSVDGVTRTLEQWMMVVQMFNHQTHHRGQVTTLLAQQDVDIGSTDIPFMPGLAVVS